MERGEPRPPSSAPASLSAFLSSCGTPFSRQPVKGHLRTASSSLPRRQHPARPLATAAHPHRHPPSSPNFSPLVRRQRQETERHERRRQAQQEAACVRLLQGASPSSHLACPPRQKLISSLSLQAKRVLCHPSVRGCPRCLEKGIACVTPTPPPSPRPALVEALADSSRPPAAALPRPSSVASRHARSSTRMGPSSRASSRPPQPRAARHPPRS